jgi:hypothetical protein
MRWRLGGTMPGESIDRPRGGYERVARYFIAPCAPANLIRLVAYDPRRALSRRRLARLIDSRRVVS